MAPRDQPVVHGQCRRRSETRSSWKHPRAPKLDPEPRSLAVDELSVRQATLERDQALVDGYLTAHHILGCKVRIDERDTLLGI